MKSGELSVIVDGYNKFAGGKRGCPIALHDVATRGLRPSKRTAGNRPTKSGVPSVEASSMTSTSPKTTRARCSSWMTLPRMARRTWSGAASPRSALDSVGVLEWLHRAAQSPWPRHSPPAKYIVSIDDDAEFTTPSIVSQTLGDFDHPRIAAVSIPHKDIRVSPLFKTPAPPGPGRWVVPFFIGTAHALRREVFLQMGGYRASLVHNTEERDFCVRLMNFGCVARLGTADAIHHYISPVRDTWRARMFERRNDICNILLEIVPFPHLLWQLPGTVIKWTALRPETPLPLRDLGRLWKGMVRLSANPPHAGSSAEAHL